MNNDTRQEQYNKFSTFSGISYNIVKYLINNDDEIWKLLKYNSPDAWNKPNLTQNEKSSLIYDGTEIETDFRVFMDLGQEDSWNIQASTLRISPPTAKPNNYVWGSMEVGFEIYSHYRLNHLSNYTTRIDVATQRLIEVLNGADIDGLGRLYFDTRANPMCRIMTIGQIPYKGRALILCTQSLG
jgi:hypothetical protein